MSKPSDTEIEQRGLEAFGKAALTVLLCAAIAGGMLLMLFVSF